MCHTFLMFNPDAGSDQWQLVLINNRDELYDRPTRLANWENGILAGRDLVEKSHGGMWLGITETGRIGNLLNVGEPPENRPKDHQSRGSLVLNYLNDPHQTPMAYAESLGTGQEYPGFSLLLIDKPTNDNEKWRVVYCTNRWETPIEALSPGVYSFSNCPRHRPFMKTQRGFQLFQHVLPKYLLTTDCDKWPFVEDLVGVLKDKTSCFPDSQLQSQYSHLPPLLQQKFSSCFVEFPEEYKYGTRTHSVILIDGADNVTYVEKTMNEKDWKGPWIETRHEFTLKKTSCSG